MRRGPVRPAVAASGVSPENLGRSLALRDHLLGRVVQQRVVDFPPRSDEEEDRADLDAGDHRDQLPWEMGRSRP